MHKFSGNVTEGDTLAVMPFGNLVDIVTVTGKNLRDQLELAVQDYNPKSAHGRFLQFSGDLCYALSIFLPISTLSTT